MKKYIVIFSFLVLVQECIGQRILIVNGTAHIGNGEIVETAAIGIQDGKILFVKNALTNALQRKDWDTIIDAENQHVYPGLVAANSTLGLTEIDAVRATRDFNDVGELNPHVRSQVAFNVESRVIETVRTNGVMITQATPRGGVISGSSSLMYLSGWNWEDATVLADDGIHVNWPTSTQGGGWWAEPAPKSRNQNYQKEKQTIIDFFDLAKVYTESQKNVEDLRLNAMKACFDGQKRVFFHADGMQQILDIIDFVNRFQLKYPVIIGGYEAHLVGQRLKDAKIPIMLNRIHSLPEREEDDVNLPYALPALLQKQGVLFCIQNAGDMEAMNARNLPFQAGTAMAYGLTEEEALQAISLNPCKIMGIDDQFGTIEAGKSATLFISKGPALEMKSNQVTCLIFHGQIKSTTNFQGELYLKYKRKYQNK
ncbi:MAG: amidohydrolase family protein [Flavobacteriales bacterium]